MSDPQVMLAEKLRMLLLRDPHRLAVIESAECLQREAQLPDALLAAGFLRNCVWDYIHQYEASPCNDVDIIYFDSHLLDPEVELAMEHRLTVMMPGVAWEVKNQARMASRHADPMYTSALHAMSFWPERETAVAMRLDGSRSVVSAFGLGSLFDGVITVGPHRSSALVLQRALNKRWFERWHKLQYAQV